MRLAATILAVCLGFATVSAQNAARRIAVVLDTSGSMDDNDEERYAVQLSQVLSDLTDDGDELAVIGFPYDGSCRDRADPRLMVELDSSQRADFKRILDQRIRYSGGTHYAAPLRTAADYLGQSRKRQRLLLIIADSQGLGPCQGVLGSELLALRDSGVFLAAVNIGSSRGAFDRNPAIDLAAAARGPEEMARAVARVYQRFLGAKTVQTGRVSDGIEVEIHPYCKEAFLVTIADGRTGDLSQEQGNPSARSVDLDFRGGGRVRGLDGLTREYRIVRLDRPASGMWRFNASQLRSRAAWMLIQEFSLAVELASPPSVALGTPSRLELRIVDETTGQPVRDLSTLPGLELTVEIDGQRVRLQDDGSGADRRSGDGILSAEVQFDSPGRREITARLSSDLLDLNRVLEIEATPQRWRMILMGPKTAEVGSASLVAVQVAPAQSGKRPAKPPDSIQAAGPGISLVLRDDGSGGDAQAGDGVFSARWTPNRSGEVETTFKASGGSPAAPLVARLNAAAFGWKIERLGSNTFDLDYPSTVSARVLPALAERRPSRPPERIEVSGQGLSLRLRDDGVAPDDRAGDGIYRGSWTPNQPGTFEARFRAVGGSPASPVRDSWRVAELGWQLETLTPDAAAVGESVRLQVRVVPTQRGRVSRRPPDRIEAIGDGLSLQLVDDGTSSDSQAGDRIYSALWRPDDIGPQRIEYRAVGGSTAGDAVQTINVQGRLRLGSAPPIDFGPIESGQSSEGVLDLSSSDVRGDYRLTFRSDFRQSGVSLEIYDGSQWQRLGEQPIELPLSGKTTLQWPVRVSAGSCPEGSAADEIRRIWVAAGGSAASAETEAEVRATVLEDTFLECWWPLLALLLASTVTGIAVHGYWWPSRFPARLGLVLSTEEDMEEGFFHPIRAQRGTGSGFYRHASCYVRSDFRLSGNSAGALARLRAQGNRVSLQPVHGTALYRKNLDDEWEPLDQSETVARFGSLYRNEDASLFFEIRNG